jgi:dihydrofolate reductase
MASAGRITPNPHYKRATRRIRMPNVIYAMGGVSADGYVVGPDGKFDWSVPDDELHRFHNEQTRALSGHLLGRRLYETMLYWETADEDPAAGDIVREFALIWRALPKVVFSRNLDSVEGTNTTLARDDLRAELTSLQESVGGDVGVGGAELAAEACRLNLIDEYRLFVYPVAVGGGIPFFPRDHRVDLELVETRTFGSRVAYLRYRAAGR